MTTTTCPDGHASTTTDFCDVCGIAMTSPPTGAGGPASGAAGDGGSAGSGEEATPLPPPERGPVAEGQVGRCPNCGTPRGADDAFCEVCGLDYRSGELPSAAGVAPAPAGAAGAGAAGTGSAVTGSAGPGSVGSGSADGAAGATGAAQDLASAGARGDWVVVVTADREWWEGQEVQGGTLRFPDAPTTLRVPLAGALVAVGRRSEADGWYPGVDLGHVHDDPGVSRHHGEFVAHDGRWAYVDTGSTNGSTVDGTPAEQDQVVPMDDGTVVHLGAWTRMTVQRVPAGGSGR